MNRSPISARHAARILLVHCTFWFLLSAAGALSSYSDRLHFANPKPFAELLLVWIGDHVPVALLSSALAIALVRQPDLFTDRRRTVGIYAALLLLFLPLEWLYIEWLELLQRGAVVTPSSFWTELREQRQMTRFVEGAWMTGTFIAMAAIGNWREAKARHAAFQRAHTENLNLHLALEQQRMLALRAQLEPHFIFNALNAISALVRSGEQANALAGISRLSDLLRYALAATLRDDATIAAELQFLHDYLALQRLRYGERLQLAVEGVDDAVRNTECPPLLLQPLIENALRHDLDCHDKAGDIRLCFEQTGARLLIRISNCINAGVSPNPGLGLGLATTRERLALSHPGATLVTRTENQRFVAEISLPVG